jgi:hypothetical protein
MEQGDHFISDNKQGEIPHIQLLSGTESPLVLELENYQTPGNKKW